LADGIQPGYVNDVLLANASPAITAATRRLTGGAPKLKSIQQWFDRNPLYRLAQAKTAIRIEAMDPNGLLGMWETYYLLKANGNRVSLIYFPEGDHVLWSPREKYVSQQGNVNWYRFWLQGKLPSLETTWREAASLQCLRQSAADKCSS
jgi:hypothetical protein